MSTKCDCSNCEPGCLYLIGRISGFISDCALIIVVWCFLFPGHHEHEKRIEKLEKKIESLQSK